MVFTSDSRQNKKIDTWISKANASLHELYYSNITKTKWELSNTAKFQLLNG